MSKPKIISSSLKDSFSQILRNKPLFALLFVLQIIFFAFLFLISSMYVPKILEHSRAMYTYMNSIPLDEVSVTENLLQQKSILGDDPLSLSRNLEEIIKNFRMYTVYLFLLLLIFISAIWAVSIKMMHKHTRKELLKCFTRIFIILFFYLGIIFLFLFSIINISFTEAAYDSSKIFGKYILFFLVSIVLLYFMFISIFLAGRTGLKNILQKTLSVGFRNFYRIIAVYAINILLISAPLLLLAYFSEISFLAVIVGIVLFVFSFLFGRIFMSNVVDKSVKSEEY